MGLDAMGIGSIADLLKTGIDKIWPDPTKRAEAQIALLNAQQAGALKEMDAELQTNLAQIAANAAVAQGSTPSCPPSGRPGQWDVHGLKRDGKG